MVNIVIIRNAYSHDFGGGERFPVFLAKSLLSHDYNPIILSRNPSLLRFATKNGILTVRGWWWSRQNWSGRRAALFPVYMLWQLALYCWYRQLFAQIKPQVVHIQSKDDFIAATYAAKHAGARVVWTDHADLKHVWSNLRVPFKNPVGKWVHLAAKRADNITVVSNSELSAVTAHLGKSSSVVRKITVIYNGCADVLASYPPTAKPGTVTYVVASRLVTDKGIGEAIEAYKKLHAIHSNTRLVIAGDGPKRNKFATQAAGIDTIEFVGHQTDPYKVMSSADVFLQPSYHEGFSVVLVEACMLQKAIIATSVGGNTEIIRDRDTGLLVPAKNSDALFDAMKILYMDEDLRNKLASSARERYLQEFVFDTIVKERFIPLYDKATH